MSGPPAVSAGWTRRETRAVSQPLERTRAGTRATGDVQMVISGTQNEILAMMIMAMGRGTALENAMMLEEKYERLVVYAFNPDINPNPEESEFSLSPVDAHIGEVGKAPKNWAEVQASKYAVVAYVYAGKDGRA